MPKHEAHVRIRDKTLRDEPKTHFRDSHHNSTWLASIVVAFSQQRDKGLARHQRKALEWFRTDCIFNLGAADAHRKDDEVLAAYKNLFNQLFFFESLEPHRCRLYMQIATGRDVYIKAHTRREDESYKLKWSFPIPERKKQIEAHITIFRTDIEDRREMLKDYLGTLLHEMIHAFLDIWGCHVDGCYNDWTRQGVQGHGHAWQDIAHALEIAVADKDMLGIDLELGRLRSLAADITFEKRDLPEEDVLERWNMDQGEVERVGGLVEKQHLFTKVMGGRLARA